MQQLPYRVILTDLDGTLLDSRHEIPERTKAALQRLTARGVAFAMVSARMPEAIYPVAERAGCPVSVVSYSGALAEGPDGKVLKSTVIPEEPARRVLDTLAARWPEAVPNFYAGRRWYVERPDCPFVRLETEVTGAVPSTGTPFSRLLEEGVLPHKLLCMAEDSQCEEIERELQREFPELNVIRSCGFLLEIMEGSVSKASGVQALLAALGLEKKDAVAFGDSYNDIPMLREAGMGVAMENAPETVKAAADAVTASNHEEGVWHFLRKAFGSELLEG